MVKVTKTINPLHFEDLEPHRFEDLVRQLIYDFRQWKSLEAIGRLGADEGIDIKATENVGINIVDDNEEELADESLATKEEAIKERLWIMQCKRENTIGPQRVRDIISNNLEQQKEKIYGYIFIASCDFSKKARDVFREECVKYGLGEYYIWGRSEIEDLLFLPKNDHLLFAYFGISLQIKRKTLRTEIKSTLMLKRKLVKEIGDINVHVYKHILIRDPRDENYPYIDNPKEFIKSPRWRYWEFQSHYPPDHLAFIYKKYYAYANWDTKEYDILDERDAGIPYERIFGLDQSWVDPDKLLNKYRNYWINQVPKVNQSWAIEIKVIPYERILALDEIGDSCNIGPHLLVEYLSDNQPFEHHIGGSIIESTDAFSHKFFRQNNGKRIVYFPSTIPDS